ncbi:PREDICTED: brain acid soluble protein 1-like [Papilio polytes]|uniref:brain acid soluble protein 1-like n=1 Tax=Papilio polytes TaxID=76194 RepID=UPI000675D1C1|nr:PREDICTED: brain acid soluble protein 1-like [Papilio polytes]
MPGLGRGLISFDELSTRLTLNDPVKVTDTALNLLIVPPIVNPDDNEIGLTGSTLKPSCGGGTKKDADALKPQLNGDAHIHEPSDKEKQLDIGTPENEKDATTEKENKEVEEAKEKETPAVTNGDSEQKEENGDAAATPEEAKKPKKEKVKKKWSLRSISFSRKDKPKQEKKAKDDEAKTPNGETEKLPEEAAESVPENAVNEVAEEAKSDSETKDEKTPETPVTEPITNGSNTPESPKTESSPTDEPIPETPEDNDRPEPKAASPEPKATTPEPKAASPEPEKLPVNGLSLEEPKVEAPEVPKCEDSSVEKATTETSESVPAPVIPVTKQDVLPMSDKLADLIPEIPVVPELKTELESASDVAVAN